MVVGLFEFRDALRGDLVQSDLVHDLNIGTVQERKSTHAIVPTAHGENVLRWGKLEFGYGIGWRCIELDIF